MKKTVPSLVLAALSVLALPASAVVCDVDEVPAATLLLPYFETDLVGPGLETIVSMRNVHKDPVLANVVVWSDLGVPVFSFPVGLKGYDSYDFSVHNLLVDGVVPASYRGTFTSCGSALPVPTIAPTLLQAAQEALTGRPVVILAGQCVGLSLPGRANVAHGYITVDTVRECTTLLPTAPDYFRNNGTGIATNENKLMGHSIFLDSSLPMAHYEHLVHVEAGVFAKGDYTFYGRLEDWSGNDEREPLATNFAAGFANGGFFGATELFVWRDTRVIQPPFPCGSPPTRLNQTAVVAFDNDGGFAPVPGIFFGAAAQRVDLVAAGLRPAPPPTGDFGWFFLNLGHRKGKPPTTPQRFVAQGWVVGLINSAAPPPVYTGSTEAVRFDSACKGKAKPNAKMPQLP